MPEFTRRQLVSSAAMAAVGMTGVAAAEDDDTDGAPYVDGDAQLFATTALGAEVTGPFVFQTNEVLFSLQHPDTNNPSPYGKGAIGVVENHSFDMNGRNDDFDELSIPKTKEAQSKVRTANGEFTILASEAEEIDGGNARLGVPQTPDGTDVDSFAGSRYSNLGHNPDMNQFVSTNDDGTEGYLFTNWEQSPGEISRIPISRDENGWSADRENAINLSSLDAFREFGGTRIDCGGDLSPWGTPMPAEEEYSHPITTGTASVSDMLKSGSGVGMRGAGHFFNRPNPSEIQDAVDTQYGDDSWYVQGYWALTGVELLSYYLGQQPRDQTDGKSANTDTKLLTGDSFPNKYRYGYLLDIRKPTAETPEPMKYYAMGRASWELPEVAGDQRTVFMTSDGEDKGGLYKFVAEKAIPEYDDPMDLRGTLYAPRRVNSPHGRQDPKDAVLELEWLPLGTATNREVESWIADYDDVDQMDYMEHAETRWWVDFETALAEADREVAENGNKDYISDEMIVAWAEQYEQHGPNGVDERLRRVPFLETRAATREIQGTVEFRKSEGIDTDGNQKGAEPGDNIYIGLAEVNAGMGDSEGDLQHNRVDGGMVYRGRVDRDYNVTRLVPAVVGPDGTDPSSVADKTPMNVDNTYVMPDGRVLLCEDADQLGRSYPNDGMYVYEPSNN
ncbi:MAG: alkaline phosphatase PhoX [Halobaculum sp.]